MGSRKIKDEVLTTFAAKKRLVLSITRMTSHNGPGLRTLILFKGCPLRCLWCSTPESQELALEVGIDRKKCTRCGHCVSACTLDAISLAEGTIILDRTQCNGCGACIKVCYPEALRILGRYMTVEQIVEEAEKDAIIFKHSGGGVTISGGEPLLEPDFNIQLVRNLNAKGIKVGIDTCGYVPWRNIELALQYISFFLWDLKHMDSKKHQQLTGKSNELILANVQRVSERDVPLYIRVPVIPGYNDSLDNIRSTCEFVRSLKSIVQVDLLPVHHLGRARYESLDRNYPIAHVSLIPDEVTKNLKRVVESYGLKCTIGG